MGNHVHVKQEQTRASIRVAVRHIADTAAKPRRCTRQTDVKAQTLIAGQIMCFSMIDVNDNESDSNPKVKCIHEEQIFQSI